MRPYAFKRGGDRSCDFRWASHVVVYPYGWRTIAAAKSGTKSSRHCARIEPVARSSGKLVGSNLAR